MPAATVIQPAPSARVCSRNPIRPQRSGASEFGMARLGPRCLAHRRAKGTRRFGLDALRGFNLAQNRAEAAADCRILEIVHFMIDDFIDGLLGPM
jgi:hypothetical protein